MLAHDVIELAASPLCSDMVMAKKCDCTMLLCIDYHKANNLIKKDKFPLPKMDTCLDMLNGCHYFSSCDMRQGYWQTVVDKRDHNKTTFITGKG